MGDTIPTSEPKRRCGLRLVAWTAAGLVVILIVAYFVVSSGAFFKAVILPKVSRSLGAEVTAAEASVRPFSQVVLRGLKVQVPGRQPVLTAQQVRVRYSLRDILRGHIKLDELTLEAPVLQVVYEPDGTSNADPFLRQAPATAPQPAQPPQPAPPPPARPAQPTAPLQVDIKQVALQDATLRLASRSKEGGRDAKELTNLQLTLQNIKNGQTGKLTLSSDLAWEAVPPPGTNASLRANLAAEFDFGLTAELQPQSVKGQGRLTVAQASGGLAQADGLVASLACELTPTEVKTLGLGFLKGTTNLGSVQVTGPFDLAKQEGRLQLQLERIDRNLLNLAGGPAGLDFGQTLVTARSDVQIANAGNTLSLTGQVALANFTVAQPGTTTPPLNLELQYAVAVDQPRQTARLQSFNLVGVQNQHRVLEAALTAPMTLTWAKTNLAQAAGDATLRVTVTNLNLADWKALVGNLSGRLDARLQLESRRAGQELAFGLEAQLADFAMVVQTNQVRDLALRLNGRGVLTDLKVATMPEFAFELKRKAESALQISGSGQVDLTHTNADLRLSLQGALRHLLAVAPLPGLIASSGTFSGQGTIAYRPDSQAVNGSLSLKGLNGSYIDYPLKNVDAGLEFDTIQTGRKLEFRRAHLALPATARAQNRLQLTGQVDSTHSNAITGSLQLQADALDLTAYYDMIVTNLAAPTGPAAAGAAPAPAPAQPPSAPSTTPPAPSPAPSELTVLPFKDLSLRATVGRCWLREVEMTNLTATLTLNSNRIDIRPVQAALNGTPAQATVEVDLSVRGYQYALEFQARDVPLAPLVNSFQPDYKGAVSGTATAFLQLKGINFAESGLQKNLAGQFDLQTTNLNLALERAKIPVLDTVIGTVRELPQLLTKLPGGLGGVVGAALGARPEFVAWTNALAQSPINAIVARATAGAGRVQFQRASVQSPAFIADLSGTITLAPALTNSTLDMPVQLALHRSLAEKIKLVPAGTPPEASFVALRPFLKVGGTLGQTKREIDTKALLAMVAESSAGIPGLKDTPAGDLLRKFSGAAGGATPPSPATVTNGPATNKPPVNPLDLLPKFRR